MKQRQTTEKRKNQGNEEKTKKNKNKSEQLKKPLSPKK